MAKQKPVSKLTVPETMARLAEAAVEGGAEAGIVLDYSLGSIEQLETVLAHWHGVITGTVESTQRPSSEDVRDGARMYGAYVGEVLRRSGGGAWLVDRETNPSGPEPAFALVKGKVRVFPIDKVLKRLLNGQDDNVWFYFQMIQKHWGK